MSWAERVSENKHGADAKRKAYRRKAFLNMAESVSLAWVLLSMALPNYLGILFDVPTPFG